MWQYNSNGHISLERARLQKPCPSFFHVLLLLSQRAAARFGLCPATLQLLKLLRKDLTDMTANANRVKAGNCRRLRASPFWSHSYLAQADSQDKHHCKLIETEHANLRLCQVVALRMVSTLLTAHLRRSDIRADATDHRRRPQGNLQQTYGKPVETAENPSETSRKPIGNL